MALGCVLRQTFMNYGSWYSRVDFFFIFIFLFSSFWLSQLLPHWLEKRLTGCSVKQHFAAKHWFLISFYRPEMLHFPQELSDLAGMLWTLNPQKCSAQVILVYRLELSVCAGPANRSSGTAGILTVEIAVGESEPGCSQEPPLVTKTSSKPARCSGIQLSSVWFGFQALPIPFSFWSSHISWTLWYCSDFEIQLFLKLLMVVVFVFCIPFPEKPPEELNQTPLELGLTNRVCWGL